MIQTEKKNIEILGPYIAKSFRGKTEFRLLLKSSSRESLYSVVKRLSGVLQKLRDVRLKVDVDPVTI
jgi:primosomal protein N'